VASELAARRLGSGPQVILLHGGVGPEITWELQQPLAERWRLMIPWRRGFEPSPAAERQDFEVDAEDLLALLEEAGCAHVVGFSYGGVGAAIAAGRRPELVVSLVLVEPPLYSLAPDDPEIRELIRLGDAFLAGGQALDDPDRQAFLELAGMGDPESREHAIELESAQRLALGGRLPGEASPDVDAIVSAGIPALVMSAGHHPALEKLCDAIAERIGGWRVTLPGVGHAVPRAPGFNERLEEFLSAAQRRREADQPGR
jgi:pimeloyl-ACP methyl ester carboxylesterase